MSPASLVRDDASDSQDSAHADALGQGGLVLEDLKGLGGAGVRDRGVSAARRARGRMEYRLEEPVKRFQPGPALVPATPSLGPRILTDMAGTAYSSSVARRAGGELK